MRSHKRTDSEVGFSSRRPVRSNVMISSLIVSFKLTLRRFLRLPLLGRFFIVTAVIFFFVFVLFKVLFLFVNVLNRAAFLEFHKCPACYGFKACDTIERGEIIVDRHSSMNGLLYSDQYLMHGKHVDGTDVMISKLGTKEYSAKWEDRICKQAKKQPNCHVSEAAYQLFPNSGSKWILEAVRGQSLMTTCPTERLISTITFRYTEMLDAIDISNKERIQLVLTIWRNQEPIIYQVFSKSTEWPFPRYLGACGRAVVYENPGKPLYMFYGDSWELRIRLALKILNIAHKFTFNPSQYGIYMMKLDSTTFHYKVETKELFYTSAQDILIVDKWQLDQDEKEKAGSRKDIYIKAYTPCEVDDDYSVDKCKHDENWLNTTDKLCNSAYSDHNYYAVCRNILAPVRIGGKEYIGLLHDMPANIDTLFGLDNLIHQCLHPLPDVSRKDTVLRMIKNLKDIIGYNEDDNSEDDV